MYAVPLIQFNVDNKFRATLCFRSRHCKADDPPCNKHIIYTNAFYGNFQILFLVKNSGKCIICKAQLLSVNNVQCRHVGRYRADVIRLECSVLPNRYGKEADLTRTPRHPERRRLGVTSSCPPFIVVVPFQNCQMVNANAVYG